MASACLVITRGISTSCASYGKRNFRKFLIYGKRGTKLHKEQQLGPNRELPIDQRGVRKCGYNDGEKFIRVPEMIPEIIVPSLEGCNLKPYVTYQSENVTQGKFTANDLFEVVYAKKIVEDFKNAKLTLDGQPLHPSNEEKLTPREAKDLVAKTGADMFQANKNQVLRKYLQDIRKSKQKAKENQKSHVHTQYMEKTIYYQ